MSNYKLYRVTVEKEFVIAAPAEDTLDVVESSVNAIMRLHSDDMRSEAPTQVTAQEIKGVSDLPDDWVPSCLPYTNHGPAKMPIEIINKTIKDYLEDGDQKTNP